MSERSIFLAALDIADPAERSKYLDGTCQGNAALRHHIDELVAAEAKLGKFLDKPHVAVDLTADIAPVTERPGNQIGPYKLLEQIGEGGFGVVFMAEQQQPVRRKVALKVVKAGMDTRQVIARFEAERQALALMDHPNIARVLDAGATSTGRPYFVMELVKGIPITQFCDEGQLTTRERLELFIAVCQAAQHAHQKGIIHRDIKPSNVLVTLHDGTPVVKVIDFGVAKATGYQLTEKTLFTGFAQMVGTPLYMSPEQAALSGLDIDTRSDIYSLGVLLYELLTGTTPLQSERLKKAAFDEIRRIIREEEAVKPSTRISTLGATATSVSAHRKTEPKKLSQLLRNELDWIVMKALEKDRTRRYETASAFAADVGRYLRDEHVEACPPSTVYRLKKFYRRNRAALTTGLIFFCSMFILAASMVVVALIARHQREQARMARREAEIARRDAEGQRDQALKSKTEESRQRLLAEERETESKAARLAEAEQRKSAEEQRDKATTLNNQLQSLTTEQRRTLYAAEMNLVRLEAQRSNLAGMRELLLKQLPGADEEDLRGFEWNYWYRFLHQAKVLLRLDETSNSALAESATIIPGGELVAVLRSGRTELIELATGKVRRTGPAVLRVGADRTSFDTSGRMIISRFTSESAFRFVSFPSSTQSLQVLDVDRQTRTFETPPGTLKYLSYGQISPDGKLVAAIGVDATHKPGQPAVRILIWDLASGNLLHSLLEPHELNRIRFSNDASLLAAFVCHSSVENVNKVRDVVTVFDTVSGERTGLVQHDDDVDQLVFLPDNQHLICTTLGFSGRNRKELFRWKIGEPALVRLGAEHMPDYLAPAVSPDGKLFAVASHTIPNVRLIDTTTGAVVHNLHSEATNITSITFTPDGKQLIACGTKGVVLAWDLGDGDDLFAIRAKPLPRAAYNYAITSDQSLLAYAENPSKIQLRRRDGTETTLAPAKPGNPRATVKLVFSPDGKLLSTVASVVTYVAPAASREASSIRLADTRRTSVTLQVYDLATNKHLWGEELPQVTEPTTITSSIVHNLSPPPVAFSADGKHLVFVRAFRREVWDASSGKRVESPTADSAAPVLASDLVLTAGGPMLFADLVSPTADQAQLRLRNAITGAVLAEINVPAEPAVTHLVPSPNAQHIALLRGSVHQAELWHVGQRRKTFESTGNYVVFSTSGIRAALVETSIQPSRGTPSSSIARIDRATLWDVAAGRQLSTVTFLSNRPENLLFSPDGKRLLSLHGVRMMSGGAVPEGRLWDVLSGREMMTIPVADVNHYAWDMAFDPTGNKLVSCMLVKPNGSGGDGWGASIFDGTPLSEREDALLVAHPLLANMFSKNPLAGEVIAELEANPKLRPSVRQAAIALAKARENSPEIVAEACMKVLASEFGHTIEYERALKWAHGYQRRWPDDPVGAILTGGAQFRLGKIPEALASLSSEIASRPAAHTPDANRLRKGFLALAHLHAGHIEKAEEHYLAFVKENLVDNRSSGNAVASPMRYISMNPIFSHPLVWLEPIGKLLFTRYDKNADGQIAKEEFPTGVGFGTSFDRNRDGVLTPEEYARTYASNLRSRMEPVQRLESLQTAMRRDPTDPGPYLQLGDLHYAKQEYDQAIEQYSQVIRLAREDTQGYLDRGYCYFQKLDYDKALEDFNEALRLNPKSALAYSWRAHTHSRKGQTELAHKDFDECLRLDPQHVNSLGNRARLLRVKGDNDAALRDLDEAIKLDPQYAYAYGQRGMIWYSKSQSDKAIADFTEAVRLNSKDDFVFAHRGACWRTKREYDKALADFDEAIKINQKSHWAIANRGAVWVDKGNYDNSLADYDEAIRLNPNVAWYYNGRGIVWNRKGQSDKAINDYEVAIRLDPKNASYYSNRGWQWQQKREIDKAFSDFSKAIELSTGPNLPTYLRRRGDLLMNEELYDRALADYDELVRLAPDAANSYGNRGVVWLRMWEFDKALNEFDEAVKRDAKSATHLNNRGAVKAHMGRLDEALADFDSGIKINPKVASLHLWRGIVLEKKGQQDEANQEYEASLQLFPTRAAGLADRADRWLRYREYGKALADFAELLKLDPENSTYLNQRALLLAAAPDQSFRDGNQAIQLATKANEITNFTNPIFLDTLAAAHAETNNFTEAMKWQEKAASLAPELTRAQYTIRLTLYRENKPFRLPPPTPSPSGRGPG